MAENEPVVAPVVEAPAKADTLLAAPATAEPAKAAPAPETKPQGEQAPVPEQYELKLPEGSLLDAPALEQISAFAKENNLSKAQAEKFLMREHEAKTRFVEGQNEQLQKTTETWMNQVKEDKEIGGDNLNQNVEMAKRVVKRFGTEAFIKELNDSGLGNHPELVRIMSRIGKAMKPDSLVVAGSQTSGGQVDTAELLFGAGTVQANNG